MADLQLTKVTPSLPPQPLDPVDIVRETLQVVRECRRAFRSRKTHVTVLADGREILRGSYYRARREEVLARDQYQCVRCGTGYKLQVHHRVKVEIARDDRMSNLLTLCAECHTKEHLGEEPCCGYPRLTAGLCAWRTEVQ